MINGQTIWGISPPKRVTSATWVPPPPCKQTLRYSKHPQKRNRGYWQHVGTEAKNWAEWFFYISVTLEKDDFFKSMTQPTRKDNLSSPNKSRTYDLLVTSADALPLSYRGFVEAIKATKRGSCEETSCILLGLERPYVTYAVAMIETRYSTSEQKETRGKWYGTYQTKFQSGSSLICYFNVGVYCMCFYSIHTKRERKRLCELKKAMQPTKQEQWQTAVVTSQRRQLDISSDSQCNIWWQFTI